MDIIAVTCNNCGSRLDVRLDMRYVTCGFCKSRLEIKQRSGSFFVRTLESVARRTEEISDGMEILMLQNELEQLDRNWASELKERRGDKNHRSVDFTIALGRVAAAITILATAMAFALWNEWDKSLFVIFHILFWPIVFFTGIGMYFVWQHHLETERMEARYKGNRWVLVRRLVEARAKRKRALNEQNAVKVP